MHGIDQTVVVDINQFKGKNFDKKIPVLTCMTGSHVGRRIMLADDRITLGRASNATIMLHDSHISRIHLAIEHEPESGRYRIQDLGSSNGTLLNDTRITEAFLRNSDKITIGSTLLGFGWEDEVDLQYQAEMDQRLNIDELTGLMVKRRFDEELNRHVAVAASQGDRLAMIMMDMDGLKRINDTYGHTFGSYAISKTGELIRNVIGRKGLASRFGGDEFMAFLPKFHAEEARAVAEEIRANVERFMYEKNGVALRPTISIGVSDLKSDDHLESLLHRADEALYRSKRAGRNRVSVSA